ncbi:MAG: hypothetical protein IJ814_02830 [Paludibacteraceae bacterium]|nr:hypothetical protein [Paludibacteraceae bacterium]
MMGTFGVALALDEYGDYYRAAQDVLIETCVEIEAEDYEWDEADEFSGTGIASPLPLPEGKGVEIMSANAIQTNAYQSDDQKRGLVRRYAPRKGFACAYYILT